MTTNVCAQILVVLVNPQLTESKLRKDRNLSLCMKALRLGFLSSLLAGSAFAAAPVIPPALANLAGNYQALLYTQANDVGSPTAWVTVTLTNKGALTGKLTTEENKTYAFKTTLNYTAAESPEEGAPIGTAAQATAISIVRGKNLPNWNLNLSIKDLEEAEADSLTVKLTLGDVATAETDNGFKQIVFAKGAQPYAAAGAYTAAFELADTPTSAEPAGSGYATATIDAKGLLKLVGKTGDGTAITASLPAGPDNRYVAFLNPYKRINSLFAGKITLTERTSGGFHAVPAATGYDFQWKKSSLLPKTTDKSYRAGFGPLDVLLTMEPWAAFGKTDTLAATFGVDSDESFAIAYDGVFPGTDYSKYVPVKADFKPTGNTLRFTAGGTGNSYRANQMLWAKILTYKLDLKTGKITATLNIEDSIAATTPTGKPKIIKRKVAFEGVFLRLDAGDSAAFAQGQIIVPPKDIKLDTVTSSMFSFGGIAVDPIYAQSAQTTGTYTATLERSSNIPIGATKPLLPYATGTPMPAEAAPVTFTISGDMETLTFAGKELPLIVVGYNSLSYSNAVISPLNNVSVQLFIDGNNKRVYHVTAQYNQGLKHSDYLRKSGTVVTKQ